MRIIALTGGIACGKSTVADMLRDLGAAIVDADEISRGQTAKNGEALPMLKQAFGEGVFGKDGTLDRAALAAVVFSDANALARLNAITHPLVKKEMEKQIESHRKSGKAVCVLDVPLLFESHMEEMADQVVCVWADRETQIDRLKSRNGFEREEAMRRIDSQMPLNEKAARSDIVLSTVKSLAELKEDVSALYDTWVRDAIKESV